MLRLPEIYPVTDTAISGLSHPEQVRRMIKGGARLIQIREKSSSSREFLEAAVESVAIAAEHGVLILINDRVDIAIAANASGVHLGQEDLHPSEARKLLGPDAVIGFSTHSAEQAAAAALLPVDYIAIGPVFATTTKDKPEPVVGIDGVAAARNAVGDKPLVAIGGIDRTNFRLVRESGADSVAVIGGILASGEDIPIAVRRFLS